MVTRYSLWTTLTWHGWLALRLGTSWRSWTTAARWWWSGRSWTPAQITPRLGSETFLSLKLNLLLITTPRRRLTKHRYFWNGAENGSVSCDFNLLRISNIQLKSFTNQYYSYTCESFNILQVLQKCFSYSAVESRDYLGFDLKF